MFNFKSLGKFLSKKLRLELSEEATKQLNEFAVADGRTPEATAKLILEAYLNKQYAIYSMRMAQKRAEDAAYEALDNELEEGEIQWEKQ